MLSSAIAIIFLSINVLAVDDTPIDDSLPVPVVLRLDEREFEATVYHSPNYKDDLGNLDLPGRIESFLIEFGPVDQNFPFTIRQVQPAGQMQLLDNGILFRGRIFNVAKNEAGDGMVKSNPSQIFFFKSSSQEVNKVRVKAPSFFDDFNGGPSDYDERRWNVAFSLCGKPQAANFNVNPQKHMHTQLGALLDAGCPSESLTARARGVFDFTDRQGNVFVDIDGGGFPGHRFFLEVGAEAKDIPVTSDARNLVRVGIDNSQLFVQQFDANGVLFTGLAGDTAFPGSEINLNGRGDNTYSIPNVRKPWVLTIDKDKMSLSINGEQVFTDLPFPRQLEFEKASVSMTHENEFSAEGGHFAVTMHSDNFGFDGPLQQLQTLSYRNILEKGFKPMGSSHEIAIPEVDDLTNATAARLVMTLSGAQLETLTFNDKVITVPILPDSVDILDPVNVVIDIPVDDVKQGNPNTINLNGGAGFSGNVHLELDYDCKNNEDRQYSPPVSQCMFASNGFPVSFNCDQSMLARPEVLIETPAQLNRFDNGGGNEGVKGNFKVTSIDTGRALRHNGGSSGIMEIQVLVDCELQATQTIDLGGAAFLIQDLDVPVEVEANEFVTREVWIRAVDGAGRSSTFNTGREEIYTPFVVDPRTGTVELAQQGRCEQAQIFIGGDCDDKCVFTAGLEEPSTCFQTDSVEGGTLANADSPNLPNLASVPVNNNLAVGDTRPLARAELYHGYRLDTGYYGDWYETEVQNDVPSRVDSDAPPFNRATDCKSDETKPWLGCAEETMEDVPLYAQQAFLANKNRTAPRPWGLPWIDRNVIGDHGREIDGNVVPNTEKGLGVVKTPKLGKLDTERARYVDANGASSSAVSVAVCLFATAVALLH